MLDGWIGRTNERMDGWTDDGWMDGWTDDGWMGGWMDGWMDGWIHVGRWIDLSSFLSSTHPSIHSIHSIHRSKVKGQRSFGLSSSLCSFCTVALLLCCRLFVIRHSSFVVRRCSFVVVPLSLSLVVICVRRLLLLRRLLLVGNSLLLVVARPSVVRDTPHFVLACPSLLLQSFVNVVRRCSSFASLLPSFVRCCSCCGCCGWIVLIVGGCRGSD